MVAKKKSAVYSVVALMLCMAVYLNWSYTKDRPDAEYNEAGEFEDSKILGEAKLVDETEQIKDSEIQLTAKDNPNISPVPSDYFSEARRLYHFIQKFLPIETTEIPADSIIREFIGNSSFKR